MGNGLGKKAITGTFWMMGSMGVAKAVAIVTNIVLARLLLPDDFGLFAIAGTAVGVVAAFGDFGTGAAVVYEQRGDVKHTNSAFWLGVLAGLAQSLAVILGAQLISELYGYALLREMLTVLSVVFILEALGETHRMLLSRELRFKAKGVVELAPGIASAAVSIVAVSMGFGVWSLVLGTIFGIALSSTLPWFLVPWRPFLGINMTQAREVLRYGKSILGLGLLHFLTENVDYLIVGRVLGTAPLGLYSQGFRLANYPETTLVWAVQKVAFPTFSKLRDDQQALRSAFLKTTQFVALLSFPVLTLLLVLSPPLVLTLYGSKWEGMILPLQILCVLGMSRSVTAVSKEMLLAVGRPDICFKCNAVALPAATLGVVVGTRFGIVGVAVAVTVFLSLGSWIQLMLTNRQIGLPFRTVAAALQPSVFCSLVPLAGLLVFQAVTPDAWQTNTAWTLVYSAMLGLFLYLLSLLVFSRDLLWEVRAAAMSLRRRDEEAWTVLPG